MIRVIPSIHTITGEQSYLITDGFFTDCKWQREAWDSSNASSEVKDTEVSSTLLPWKFQCDPLVVSIDGGIYNLWRYMQQLENKARATIIITNITISNCSCMTILFDWIIVKTRPIDIETLSLVLLPCTQIRPLRSCMTIEVACWIITSLVFLW